MWFFVEVAEHKVKIKLLSIDGIREYGAGVERSSIEPTGHAPLSSLLWP
jgi:hypothetical protein